MRRLLQHGTSLGRSVEGSNAWTESVCQLPYNAASNEQEDIEHRIVLVPDEAADAYKKICLEGGEIV
jgi:hypothetical protein